MSNRGDGKDVEVMVQRRVFGIAEKGLTGGKHGPFSIDNGKT
jgi:hypothetical protein